MTWRRTGRRSTGTRSRCRPDPFPRVRSPGINLTRGSLQRHLVDHGEGNRALSAPFPRERYPLVGRWGMKSSLSLATDRRRRWGDRRRCTSTSRARAPPECSTSVALRPRSRTPLPSRPSSGPLRPGSPPPCSFLPSGDDEGGPAAKVISSTYSLFFLFRYSSHSRIDDLIQIRRLAPDRTRCSRSRNVSCDTS